MPEQYLIDQAIDFANVKFIEPQIKASVHLEDQEDVFFWDAVIQRISPGTYNYIYHSKSDKGVMTAGCTQCLKYKGLLSKDFFVCIDSDLRYLLQEKELDAQYFIAQTFTYSWESHCCEAVNLQTRIHTVAPDIANQFDFITFFRNYSKVVYRPLITLLWCITNNHNAVTRSAFFSCLPRQCSKSELRDNGEGIVQKMKSNFDILLNEPIINEIDFLKEAATYQEYGLNEGNAYLHIKGHFLYNLTHCIGRMLFKRETLGFRKKRVKQLP